MPPHQLFKSVLHALAAALTLGFAIWHGSFDTFLSIMLSLAGAAFVFLAIGHHRVWQSRLRKTSLFLFTEALVLAAIAWNLYQMGYHKATFLYEGIAVLYLSFAAFLFLLRSKKSVLFSDTAEIEANS
jgi:hypothetical protein